MLNTSDLSRNSLYTCFSYDQSCICIQRKGLIARGNTISKNSYIIKHITGYVLFSKKLIPKSLQLNLPGFWYNQQTYRITFIPILLLSCFGLHLSSFFKTCSSYIWQFYYHSQYILDQCTHSRHYETSDIWMLPWTHRIFYTDVWTCSHQNKPQYTCVLCHWNKAREHYCWEQTHSGGVAGSQFLKMKPDSHDVKVLLQQGKKRCSNSTEYLLLWVPGREGIGSCSSSTVLFEVGGVSL